MFLYTAKVSYGGSDAFTNTGFFDNFPLAVSYWVDLAIEDVDNFLIDWFEGETKKFKNILNQFKKNNKGELVDYSSIDESEWYSYKMYFYSWKSKELHIEMYNWYDFFQVKVNIGKLNEIISI